MRSIQTVFRTFRLAFLLVFLSAFLVAGPLSSSTFLAMGRAELITKSESVIESTVVDAKSYWNEDRSMIWTEVVLQVDDLLKGESSGLVRVQIPGGQIGDLRVDAVGFPVFTPGERFVVFLTPDGGRLRVTGYRQGQYRIETQKDGVEMAVPSVGPDVLLLGPDGRAADAPKALALESLKREVREVSAVPTKVQP